ncbi:dTDP-glucose 4,6-dehydratase [Patescibacteria group bacterium]|nr:dTDP-glucose 4,6-dehydratase [Patescibacteria group bacterium]
MRLLVTGGAGFIGSHFIRYWLENYPQDSVVNFDLLTYAGNLENLSDVVERFGDRYVLVQGDITNISAVEAAFVEHKPEIVVNFAAESHNSWAIVDPSRFFRTNVLGTQTLLEVARRKGIKRFQHVSTCEVYGDLSLDSSETFNEQSPCRPRTPYNASKAGADHVVQAYYHTFDVPTIISRCSNNYGSFQFPEKVIPLFTTKAIDGQSLPLYKSSQNKREWVHVLDHCRAIDLMIRQGKAGEVYNVGTGVERTVEEIADSVLSALDLPQSMKTYVPDRPGHDRRYLLDSSKIRTEFGWKPLIDFANGLRETVQWYVKNGWWWQKLKGREVVQEDNWLNQKG